MYISWTTGDLPREPAQLIADIEGVADAGQSMDSPTCLTPFHSQQLPTRPWECLASICLRSLIFRCLLTARATPATVRRCIVIDQRRMKVLPFFGCGTSSFLGFFTLSYRAVG
ncbi:MAG: hypothetical protein NTY87_04205 [Planctomycetia bacterium]|nr:hypothetical protein [Planctomycetia bacterium]